MVSGVALWMIELCFNAQNARNSLYPRASDSPIIMLACITVASTLDHFLKYPGNPLGGLMPALQTFTDDLGAMSCETMAAMAEGDSSFQTPEDMPPRGEIQRELDSLRDSFTQHLGQMTLWRASLRPVPALSFDRRLYACVVALDELLYHESLPMASVIKCGLSMHMVAMQSELAHRNQMPATGETASFSTSDNVLDASQ